MNYQNPKETKISFRSVTAKLKRILTVAFTCSTVYDLIIVHTGGFDIYKYNHERKNIKNIRSVPLATLNFWLEVPLFDTNIYFIYIYI